MKIGVITPSSELFWYISNTHLEEVELKHLNTMNAAYDYINMELPSIVVIEGFEREQIEHFIHKIKNHVFARNTIFVVSITDTNVDFRRAIISTGAAFLLYRGNGKFPSTTFFGNIHKMVTCI